MKKNSYDQLMAEMQKLMADAEEQKEETRLLRHRLKQSESVASKYERRLKAMQTLSLSMFSMLDSEHIYSLACESVVYQLLWDCAFIIRVLDKDQVRVTAFQATRAQISHIEKQVLSNAAFMDAYVHHDTVTTYQTGDLAALDLRVLFHTDNLIATPIIFAEHLFGYLVVCSHTKQSESVHSEHDMNFLATLAAQIGQAIQNSQTFQVLEEQNAKLRQLDDLKNSFISITSHQLRTPLSIIKWILSVLHSDAALSKLKEQSHLVDQAYESNERLIRVVNNLLNVSRIQEGKLPYNPQMIDIKAVMLDLCKGVEKLCKQHDIKLEYDLSREKKIVRSADPILFKEALQNLLDNAIAYNRPGGSVRVGLKQTGDDITITVHNTGPGLTEDDQKKIFNQFYRSPEALKIQPNGTGLGLFLARAIIREHGGDITCHSLVNKETTFTVRL